MKNQDLHSSSDEQIRDLLNNMKVGYDKSSWSALENKMDSISSIEETDLLFKNSLSGFQANYIPSSWALLQYKMDYLIYNKRHLIGLKVTEFVIMLLMFWFWWGTGLDKSIPDRADRIDPTEQKTSQLNEVGKIRKDAIEPATESIHQSIPSASSIPSQILISISNEVRSPKNSTKDNRAPIADRAYNSDESKSVVSEESLLLNRDSPIILPADLQTGFAPFLPTNTLEERIMWVQSMDKNNSDFTIPKDQFPKRDMTNSIKPPIKKPFQYWLSGAISYDKDLIRTPFPSQQSVNHLGRIERNFHGEINLFVSNGMLDFQTGIGFWSKNYSSVHQGINDALVISIPANLRLRLSQRGFMRGYLMGGVSSHFVAYANYSETYYFQGLENTTIIENNYKTRPSTIFSSDSYDHGILEGESVRGNQYFTVNMGIGVDVPLNSSFSLYMEQVYFHHLSGGIGPAFDKFSTSSTIVGLRYLLNKRSANTGLYF